MRYGQYCPIAKALELLAERWTLLIVRELLMGSSRFNDLRRGVPLAAPSMLSQRLKDLAAAGIVERKARADERSYEYRLTDAGQELRPLVLQLGTWGQRWYRSRMTEEDLDASFLMWDIRRNVRVQNLPRERRIVILFEFPDARKAMRQWWLVVDDEVDLCLKDPGHEVDAVLSSSLRTMTQIWMGDISLAQARAQGLLKISGARPVVSSVNKWLGPSPFADVAPANAYGVQRLPM